MNTSSLRCWFSFAGACVLSVNAFAIDSIPLDQLKPGLWKVVRTIDRHDGSAEEVRQSEYCASPKKEITKTLRAASLLCKTNVTKLTDNKYEVAASCRLPGISGTNRTIITIMSETNYSAEVDTIGSKFGEKQHRSEKILAVRESDCDL
jgi:Protein of unknown function (DUF3617)